MIASLPKLPTRTIEQFQQQIEHEFCQGSAIDESLFAATVQICSDLEIDPAGEPTTPIHDALGWHYTRFGLQVKQTLYGALLLNEDGSCWQAKLSQPRKDDGGKLIKYETRRGSGARAFLPAVPSEIRQRIADRHGIEVPLTGSFWSWLEIHPEIPVIISEGGKKSLSLLSLGYVAISLFGCNGGYSRNAIGERSLIPDIARFAVPERSVMLAFDQDEKQETRKRVSVALWRFGGLLQQAGCNVSIVNWDGSSGKGVDDLIVNAGTKAWETAYSEALPLEHWRIWQKLENRLTYPANLRLKTADLSTLELSEVPKQGIVGVASGKGSGKTKWVAQQVQEGEAVLSAGHRIALQRNLSKRLGLNYIGHCDKVEGKFIADSAYTLRVGFCVDSLLAIDPEQFRGCDLVLDEVVQVIRHLLTSSTCAKDGKRPALLARFRALIQVARRVILADADLDNATLHYIRELRGENASVFLIRNDYQLPGYQCQFLISSDRSAASSRLLDDVAELEPGRALFVALDSKRFSCDLTKVIQENFSDVDVWLLNSDTSSGEFERSFIETPDPFLIEASQAGKRVVIVATPSLGTGASIEAQGIIKKVYGIFTGVSAIDGDMAQSLMRVREPVDRVVWCAERGTNYSKVSKSTNPLELKRHLQDKTAATVSLIRSGLREDVTGAIANYDWQSDPHVNLYSRIAAEQNWSMMRLRDALLVRLRHEGHRVTIEQCEADAAMRLLLKDARETLREMDAEAIVSARVLTLAEKLELESREGISPDDRRAVERFNLCDFYTIDPAELTTDLVLLDKEGRFRGEIANLETQLYPDVAVDRTIRALEKQAQWNQSVCPWDMSHSELRRQLRKEIGLDDFLDPDKEWTRDDLKPYADRIRARALQLKVGLHFTVSDKMSDVQLVHQLLSQFGIKISFRWSRAVPGHEGERTKIYRIDGAQWHLLTSIVDRRKTRRDAQSQPGSPLPLNNQNLTGDPTAETAQDLENWRSPDSIADVKQMLDTAESPDEVEQLRLIIPIEIWRAIA